MESKVIYAKSAEEALEQIMKSDNVDKESLQVTVIEKPAKGFLGFGAKDGVFEIFFERVSEKTLEAESEIEKNISEKEVIEETVETTSSDTVESSVSEEEEIEVARKFIEELLVNSDVKADVDVSVEKGLLKVKITGDEASCLIGRRGDTLDAIQFLTGLALNKVNKNSHTRVFVDIENYRSKREESLKRYCYKAAREVAKTRRTKKLDYMNPYERRIVHSALQNDRFVITYSEGTDPYRRVVIEYKK